MKQKLLTPFIFLIAYTLELIIYSIYLQTRLIKAPFTKYTLYDYDTWNSDDFLAVKKRQKDFILVFTIQILLNVWIWLPWYWIVTLLAIIGLLIIVLVIYHLFSINRELKS